MRKCCKENDKFRFAKDFNNDTQNVTKSVILSNED